MTNLDKLEAMSSLHKDLGASMSIQIDCSRDKFNELKAQIEEEYDISVVEDVRISAEPIPNQLSNMYGVLLHGVTYIFHIKD